MSKLVTTTNMSIPQPDSAAPSGIGEFADTALITRLLHEIYSDFGERLHGPNALRTPPTAAGETGLAGPYPANTHSYAPPVHPASSAPGSSHTGLNSGAHAPGESDQYAFGEPRCIHAAPTANPSSEQPCAKGLGEPFASPSFYFLNEPHPSIGAPGPGAIPSVSSVPSGFDIESIRRDFPALHQQIHGKPLIWLDNAATTHKPKAVIDATSQFYSRDNSNIHRAAHTLAGRATDLYEGGREKVRRFLGAADVREVVFVRGTTEAINLVAQTFGRKFIGYGDEILLTTMEHHANIVPWQLLAKETGAVIRVAPIHDRGELILDQFAALLTSRTKLVSVTQVANALGTVNPVEQIIAIAHAYGVPVLVDGAQSTPHLPVNVQALDADFFVFSGHKIFGPTGIGALYGKTKWLEQLPPWQGGGNMIRDVTFQETQFNEHPQKFEAGTQDIAGVVGLGAAIDYLENIGLANIAAYEHQLLEYATPALERIPGLRFIGTARAKASVLSFVIDGIPTEQIAKYLDREGIAVRSGHHCAQPSLRRFGLESTVRPSLAFYNTHREIDTLAAALRRFVKTK